MTGFFKPGETQFNTGLQATVYRHGRDPLPLVGSQTLARRHGGPVALVRGSQQKSLATAAGTFSLGVKEGGLDIQREIKGGDWVVLSWRRNGQKLAGMLGVIDGVHRARVSKEGVTVEDWTITGRDHGRIFDITEVWFDDYTNYETNAGGKILGQRMEYNPAGHPDQIVSNIARAWLGAGDSPRGIVGGSWRWPRGLEYMGDFFIEGLHYGVGGDRPEPIGVFENEVGTPHLRGETIDEMALFQPNPGTGLQDMMVEWSNPILN